MNAAKQAADEISKAREHMERALALLRESEEQGLSWRAYNLCAEMEKLQDAIKGVQ